MNSDLKMFLMILVATALVGLLGVLGFAYMYIPEMPKGDEVETPEETEETGSNEAVNMVRNERFGFQFELPEAYGALEDIEGEGTYQIWYYIGKFAPEIGENVIRSSISVADYLRVIPSYDSELVTLEDWREKGDVYDGTDASQVKSLTIAGLTATVSNIPGMGATTLVQFVQAGNYYEIHTEGSLEEEALAKMIETFSFTK